MYTNQNEVSDEIDKMKKSYDEHCKIILSNPQILAYIIKECIEEYKDIDINKIIQYLKKHPAYIGSEDISISGSKIIYDVLVELEIPYSTDKSMVGIVINIEAQNNDYPGYSLLNRAIYYCSRLISKQKGPHQVFQNSNYQKIRKVYSVWLCMEHPQYKNDVVNKYSIEETCLLNEWHSPNKDYDLLTVLIIYPNNHYKYDDKKHNITEFIKLLFSSKIIAQEKKMHLQTDYGIIVTQDIEQEVDTMCNLSKFHENNGKIEGRAEGLRQGKAEGLRQGKAEGLLQGRNEGIIETYSQSLKSLMLNTNVDINQAMDMINLPEDLRPIIKDTLINDDNE